MTTERPSGRLYSAFAVGITVGAATCAGTALLLYTGQGFLRAVGLLVASTLIAVAAGLWAGAPEPHRVARGPTRTRWIMTSLALIAAGAFAAVWVVRPELREHAIGGAAAVLLLLAMPAYAAGALFAGMNAHGRPAPGGASGMATAATTGTATGVLLATTAFIPLFDAHIVYLGAAVFVAVASLLDQPGLLRSRAGPSDIAGRVVIVTGVGGRGQVGYAVAERFLEAGAVVFISGRSAALDDLAASLAPHGSAAADRLLAVRADLTRDDDVAAMIEAVRDRFGRLDALINVAGGLSVIATVADTTDAEWQREIERNAGTALRISRATLPLLRASRGAIVNFASPAARRAPARLAAYSAAKAAVVALTQALAAEERSNGVRVNAIAPATIDTDQNRADAAADAVFVKREAVAAIALELVGGMETGTVVNVGPDTTDLPL